jgi:hypothetical protein
VDPFAREGLEHVVQGPCLECPERMLVIGGDEDDRGRQFFRLEQLQEREAVDLGHLDVDEQHVRAFSTDHVQGGAAIGARRDDVDARGRQISCEAFARVQLVVHDDGAETMCRHDSGFAASRIGIVTTTSAPP